MSDKEQAGNPLKEVSLTPVITALLKPSADLVGKELHDFLEKTIKALKDKRREHNIHVHLKQARERLSGNVALDENNVDVRQLDFFSDWVENVQDVDPEFKALSELWTTLLIRGMSVRHSRRLFMETLKQLEPEEADILLSLRRRRCWKSFTQMDRYYLKQLQKRELVTKPWWSFVSILSLCVIGFGCFFLSLRYTLLDPFPRDDIPFFTRPEFLALIPVRVALFNIGILVSIYIVYRVVKGDILRLSLTWLGKELVASAPSGEVKRKAQHVAEPDRGESPASG